MSSLHLRKCVAGLSAIVLLMGMAGCGNESSSSGGKTTLTFSAWDQLDDAWFSGFKKANPDIEIKFINVAGENYSQKLNQMVVGGQAPDVMMLMEGDLPRFAKNGVIDKLDDRIASSEVDVDDMAPDVRKYIQDTGGYYGLPFAISSEIMYYNKDMFDAAHVAYPTADWTWDDYADAAQQLTKTENGTTIQWGTDSIAFNGIWYSLAGEGGDEVVKDGRLELGDGLRAALEFQNTLTNELKVSPPPSSGNSVSDLFASGRAAMTRNGTWQIGNSYKNLDFNWDIAPLPAAPEGVDYNSLHTCFFALNANSKNKDAAWKFIEYYSHGEGQKLNAEFGASLPAYISLAAKGWSRVQGAHGPSNWNVTEDISLKEGKMGYSTVNSVPTLDLYNSFNAYLLGSKSIDDIFDSDVPKANKELESVE